MSGQKFEQNPFYVLGVPASATRMEVERAGQKLLAQLAIGAASAKRYRSPLGEHERDENSVRSALALLRDPEQRAACELWLEPDELGPAPAPPAPWVSAFASFGWNAP